MMSIVGLYVHLVTISLMHHNRGIKEPGVKKYSAKLYKMAHF